MSLTTATTLCSHTRGRFTLLIVSARRAQSVARVGVVHQTSRRVCHEICFDHKMFSVWQIPSGVTFQLPTPKGTNLKRRQAGSAESRFRRF